ncbi:MAG TPA: glutathione binding-like protein [Kofleriaceae bacterium]|jgi:glutathione S-transferase
MLKIYGNPVSTCTRKVLMTCAEDNVPFEMVSLDFAKAEHKGAPHVARQPWGKIPAIDDDGFELYESRAICRYLNDKVHGPLMGSDLKSRARVDQWVSIESENFSSNAMQYVYKYVFHRDVPEDKMTAATAGLEKALTVMEDQLSKTAFVAGDSFTLGDICFMPYIEYAMGTPAKEHFAKFPHVMAWWSKVSERPTWRKVAGRA